VRGILLDPRDLLGLLDLRAGHRRLSAKASPEKQAHADVVLRDHDVDPHGEEDQGTRDGNPFGSRQLDNSRDFLTF
jgi:hypothetical protein